MAVIWMRISLVRCTWTQVLGHVIVMTGAVCSWRKTQRYSVVQPKREANNNELISKQTNMGANLDSLLKQFYSFEIWFFFSVHGTIRK